MTAKTNNAEDLVINWLLTTGAVTRPTAWYVALHTADPTETGGTAELTVGSLGYARQSVTFATSSSGATSNSGTLTFGPCTTTAWGTITHISVKDASSGGNTLYKGALSASRDIAVGDSLTIAAGDLDISED